MRHEHRPPEVEEDGRCDPTMRPRPIGRTTLGIGLVAAGAVLLYNQIAGVRISLVRYWPVLLVLLGVEILWTAARGDGRVRLHPSGPVLIGLVILMAVTFPGWLPHLTLHGCNGAGLGPGKVQHQLDPIEPAIDWQGVQAIAVDTTFGQITVHGLPAGELPSVTLIVTGQAPTGPAAAEAALGAGVRISRTGGLLVLRASGERTGVVNSTARADLIIRLPSDLSLEITSEHGTVAISDHAAPVDVTTRYGGIRLDRLDGPAAVHSDHGAIRVRDLTAGLTVDATYGLVDVANVAGPLSIVSRHGKVDVNESLGAVAVETTYGNISIRYAAPPAGACAAKSRHGSVHIRVPSLSALAVEAAATRSRITTNLPGLTVETVGQGSRVVGTVHGGDVPLTARTEYGRMELHVY